MLAKADTRPAYRADVCRAPMPIEVSVTYDVKRGYVASAPDLRAPVVALSLGGLRRKIEALMLPTAGIILQLDGLAERDRRQAAPPPARTAP